MSKTVSLNGTKVTEKTLNNQDASQEAKRMSIQWAIFYLYYANVKQITTVGDREYDFSKLGIGCEGLRMRKETMDWLEAKHIVKFETPVKASLNGSQRGSMKIAQIDLDLIIAIAQKIATKPDEQTQRQLEQVQLKFAGIYNKLYNEARTVASDWSELDSMVEEISKDRETPDWKW